MPVDKRRCFVLVHLHDVRRGEPLLPPGEPAQVTRSVGLNSKSKAVQVDVEKPPIVLSHLLNCGKRTVEPGNKVEKKRIAPEEDRNLLIAHRGKQC